MIYTILGARACKSGLLYLFFTGASIGIASESKNSLGKPAASRYMKEFVLLSAGS